MAVASLHGRYPVKRAIINESTAASNEIVPAVAGKKIVAIGVTFIVDAATDLTWQSGATAISGPIGFSAAGDGMTDHDADVGLFETEPGEALNLLSLCSQKPRRTIISALYRFETTKVIST